MFRNDPSGGSSQVCHRPQLEYLHAAGTTQCHTVVMLGGFFKVSESHFFIFLVGKQRSRGGKAVRWSRARAKMQIPRPWLFSQTCTFSVLLRGAKLPPLRKTDVVSPLRRKPWPGQQHSHPHSSVTSWESWEWLPLHPKNLGSEVHSHTHHKSSRTPFYRKGRRRDSRKGR